MDIKKIVIPILLLISISISAYTFQTMNFQIHSNTELISTIYTERIQSFFERVIEPTQTIESLVSFADGELTEMEFDNLAASFFDDDYMYGISYIPDGINTYAYPYEQNSQIVGHNIYEDELGGKDAMIARDTNKTMTSGPVILPSGRVGIVIRNPIYLGDEFWGFTAVAINPVLMLESEIAINQLHLIGYEFTLHSNYNGEIISLYETDNFDESMAKKYTFSMGGSEWVLSLYDAVSITNKNITIPAVFFGSFITFMFCYVVVYLFINKQKQMKKEIYCDPLTKLYNRKYLNEVIIKNKQYTLFYIDLNDFKPINDNFSHEMGDYVLIEYAKRLQASFREQTCIFRLGGDEFAVVIETELDESATKNVIGRIKNATAEEFVFKGDTAKVSASVGVAAYPTDGESLQDVMTIADKNMYIDKKKTKGFV